MPSPQAAVTMGIGIADLITGDDIINEVLRNCEQGLFKIRNTTLLPAIYRVYLHPSDYDLVRPALKALTAETRAALTGRMDELNRKSQPSALARKLGFEQANGIEYKILDNDWTIEFHPDPEERLAKGELEIYSELASAEQPQFEGEKTRIITRRASGELPAAQTARVAESETVYAFITYEDMSGKHSFPVTKGRVVIGRGGKSYWVDLRLNAPADVSREHCRIRRESTTGKFFLKDVSQFGVTIDGQRVRSSLDGQGDQQRDLGIEVPLPDRCVIGLAGVFFLNFEVSEQN